MTRKLQKGPRSGRKNSSTRRSSGFGSSRRSRGQSQLMTQQEKQRAAYFLSGVVIFLAGTFGYIYLLKPKDLEKINKRKKKVSQILLQFQGKNEANVCTLDQSEKNKTIDWLMTKTWTAEYALKDNSYRDTYSLVTRDLVKKNDFLYEFTGQEQQKQLGKSTLTGILMFQRNYLSIFFDKEYHDRKGAGQEDAQDLLLYEAIQEGKQFMGSWRYQGFQGSNQYSGTFKMVHS